MSAARSPAAVAGIFLDKDGTLVKDVPFNVDPQRIAFLPGVASGLRALFDAGYRLCVVSNQPGVGMGLFPASALHGVEARLQELAGEAGVVLDGFFFCPHVAPQPRRPGTLACLCRKPLPGLLHAGARACGIDLARSWIVGDILDDIEAGHRAGCRAVLVDGGGETKWESGPARTPEGVVARFDLAARFILDVDTALRRGRVDAGWEAGR